MKNYIKELNAFYERVQIVPVSSAASSLWHALMHVNNIARWKESFTASAAVLKLKGGLTESSFKRARKELVEKGYITFQSRPHNQAPIYTIVSLVFEADENARTVVDQGVVYLEDQGTDQPMSQEADQHVACETDHSTDQHPGPLVKQKREEKKGNETSAAVAFYEENFGKIRPYVGKSLRSWIEAVGEELVMEAMKRALERDKTTWAYVKGILQNWSNKGIKNVEEAEKEAVSHSLVKGSKQTYYFSKGGGKRTGEIIPEWFEEHQRNERKKAKEREVESKRAHAHAQEDPVLVAEIEALLRG